MCKKRMADFEWASAARYIVHIEKLLGLQDVASGNIYSFPLGRIGPEKLEAKKRRLARTLSGNIAKLELFVGENKSDLGDNELAILRSMYVTMSSAHETCEGHAELAKYFGERASFATGLEGMEDDVPF